MQEPVDGNTMDSQETNKGLAPKIKKNKKLVWAGRVQWLPSSHGLEYH
jgi:hypothetical protein